ncbi:alpha/beta fold hydrolase [Natrinema marinum]|uniref:alpha/beta fold hydrolase n=1 Tax=Natrinema marinum TaxID=2961598 RepID=UPI0020C8817F|nr:alpha/beta hydrolase [Natrinema marinum]
MARTRFDRSDHRSSLEEDAAETGSAKTDSVSTVTVGDRGKVTYATYGDPDGAPVVVLHGTPGSLVFGQLFDDCAREYGVRVLAPERPGYGRTPPWPDRELTDTGPIIAAVLADAEVERAGLIGFSGGGPHALATAATHGDLVESIDIVSGAPPWSQLPEKPAAQRLLGVLATKTPSLLKGLLRGQTWAAGRLPPSFVLAQYTTAAERAEIPRGAAARVRRDFCEALATHREGFAAETRLFTAPWEFSLAAVDRPIRLWHGDSDGNAPLEGVRRLAEDLPNGELRVLEGAGHLTTLLRSRERVLRDHGCSDDE